ncbi:MAG: MMPL family transporter [Balneolaceae bacterium]
MNDSKRKPRHILERYSLIINRYAVLITVIYLFITGFAIHYTIQNLGINSNTSEMFDPELPFREKQEEFNELFPLTKTNFTIVIEGVNPEITEITALQLYSDLKKDTSHFENLFLPGADDFFKKNQFLFLDKEDIENLTDRLSRSNVFLSLLAQNNSLRGFFILLDMVLDQGNEEQVLQMNNLFGQVSSTIDGRLNQKNNYLSWQKSFGGAELTDQADILFIQVKPKMEEERILPSKGSIDAARKLALNYTNDQVRVRITGKEAMGIEEIESVTQGTILASVLALFFVSIILWIGLRSFRLITSSIITLIAGLAITMAFSAWAIGELNMISVAFAVLYIGLGIDYAIHFSLKYNEFILGNYSSENSFFSTVKDVGPALLLTCLSTAIGFYAFYPTSFDGVSELGLIAGTGMFISFAATFSLLPALLKIFKFEKKRVTEITLTAPFSETLSHILNTRKKWFRVIGISTAILSLFLITRIEFDYDPINLRDAKSESVSTLMDLIEADRLSPWNVEILVQDSVSVRHYTDQIKEIESSGRVLNLYSFIPDNQDEKMPVIEQIKTRISRIPDIQRDPESLITENQIESVRLLKSGIDDYALEKPENLERLQLSLQSFLNQLDGLPESEQMELISHVETGLLEYFPHLLSNLQTASEPDVVTYSSLPKSITDRWISGDNRFYRIQASPAQGIDDTQNLRIFAGQIREIVPDAAGELITFIESGDLVVKAFTEALIYAFTAITLLLLIYLRSIKYTLYILLPLLLIALLTGAAMAVFGIKFNFANIIAIPMLLGLGVDNSIHMVHRARDGTIANRDLLKTTTSRAIYFSSLTTLFSFGNLVISPHAGTASLGMILVFGVLFLIFATLIVLPAFLIRK